MSEKRSIAPWKKAALRWGGSLMVLSLLFFLLRRHLPELLATVRRVPPGSWAIVLIGYMGAHFIGVSKWRLMVNLAGAEISWRVAARCYFAGLFANMFLPSLVGGDVVRAGLGMTVGKNRAGVLLGSFFDRSLDIVAMALVAGGGALLLPSALDADSRRVFWAVAGVFVLSTLTAFVALRLFPRRLPFRFRRKLVKARQAWRSMARRPQFVGLSFAFSTTMQVSFVTLMAVLSQLAGLDIPLHLWLFAYPLAKISAMLPVTQGGIGVREAALAAILAPFGAAPARTVAVGLVWETIVIAGGLLAGLLALLFAQDGQRLTRGERLVHSPISSGKQESAAGSR
jgi:uncharacterized protein (TIRG00374 family)